MAELRQVSTERQVLELPAECMLRSSRPSYGPEYFVTFDCGDGVVTVGQVGQGGTWTAAELVDEHGPLDVIHRPAPPPPSTIQGGAPYGRGDASVDVRQAVLLESVNVVLLDSVSDRGTTVDARTLTGLELAGRVNKSTEHRQQLYLMDPDGAAAIVAELTGLALRAQRTEFHDALQRRIEQMP